MLIIKCGIPKFGYGCVQSTRLAQWMRLVPAVRTLVGVFEIDGWLSRNAHYYMDPSRGQCWEDHCLDCSLYSRCAAFWVMQCHSGTVFVPQSMYQTTAKFRLDRSGLIRVF
eukprot:scaffold57928_cov69-Attheya_sp.AAC.4